MTDKLHDWQKEFKVKEGLVELDIESLEKELMLMPRLALTNTARASKLKAAIAAGWIVSPACEVGDFEGKKRYFYNGQNIDEMHPGAVRWLGDQIDDIYDEATQIPKNL
jgi:hypothetical protein